MNNYLMTERREFPLTILGTKCNHIGNQNFDILICEQALTLGGLGEPGSAH
jgi:hypothetical protein